MFTAEQFVFGFGGTYYDNPNTDLDSTFELMGLIGYDMFLEPRLELFWDIDSAEGLYVRLSGRIGEALDKMSWNVVGSIGFATGDYNEFYFGVNDEALEDLTVTATATFPVTATFSVAPYAGVSALIDSDLRNAVDDETNLFVGVTLSWGF